MLRRRPSRMMSRAALLLGALVVLYVFAAAIWYVSFDPWDRDTCYPFNGEPVLRTTANGDISSNTRGFPPRLVCMERAVVEGQMRTVAVQTHTLSLLALTWPILVVGTVASLALCRLFSLTVDRTLG